MNYLYGIAYLVGICLSLSPLYAQSSLKNLQQIQLLSQNECVVVQINADWNYSANLNLRGLKNCIWFNASIDNKEYGAVLANEWKIKSVPTIIMFESGKEILRFEAGLSFQLDEDKIISKLKEETEKIMLRKFQ